MTKAKTVWKKLTMKRVDEEETTGTDAVKSKDMSDIREQAAKNVRPVSAFGGTFVVVGDEDVKAQNATTEPVAQVVATSPVVNDGVVSATAPADEMVEVPYSEWAKTQTSDLSNGKLTPTQLVQKLVGNSVAAAEKLLTQMKQNGEITSYRVVPIGMAMSMENDPGRVQVLRDHAGNVVNIEIG